MEMESSPENESTNDLLTELNARLEKYTSVLKNAEEEGNGSKVRRYSRIIKQYNDAITLHKKGKPVPLGELPNPPGFEPLTWKNILEIPDLGGRLTPSPQVSPQPSPMASRKLDSSPRPNIKRDISPNPIGRQGGSPMPPRKIATDHVKSGDEIENTTGETIPILLNDEVIGDDEPAPQVCGINEENAVEELTSRLEVYKNVLKTAQDEGNNSKVRRYTRIIKQYTEAIASAKKGRKVALDELPNPPGFGPLVPPKSAPPSPLPSRPSTTLVPEIGDDNSSDLPHQDKPHEGNAGNAGDLSGVAPPGAATTTMPKAPAKVSTRSDKQTAILKMRQNEYREAALKAKREGQIAAAKGYLRLCRGFDRLIEASESGFPVDLSTIPASLNESEDDLFTASDTVFVDRDDSNAYNNLEKQLTNQIKTCMATINLFKLIGDIASANRFENLALQFKRDLNFVKGTYINDSPLPKFHYEKITFSKPLINTDLSDTELELTIVQGINYRVTNPNDVDTYVTYEFPYPAASPPSGRTPTVKNTNNPNYNAKYTFPIHRDASACKRVFKRHGIKLQVWSKAGFFRSDTSLGTVVVKLMPLNSDIQIHDAFQLMQGRRAAGGKLEIKVRVREPIVSQKMERVSLNWLIIGSE